MRFPKDFADAGLCFGFEQDWGDLLVGAYPDARCASRPGGSSLGGRVIFIGPADELDAGKPTPFVAVEWTSKKLRRPGARGPRRRKRRLLELTR